MLTIWRAIPRNPGSECWIPDARPASYAQEAHLVGALAGAGTGNGTDPGTDPGTDGRRDGGRRGSPSWLGTAFELPGELDEGALETALLGWIDRHEALRSRLVATADARFERVTLAPGAVAIRRGTTGEFSTGGQLARQLEELFDAETDPLDWPSCVFATVRHADSTTLHLAFDHLNVDGYSILLVAHEIRELYTAAVTGTPAGLGQVGSYLDFAGQERERTALVHSEHESVVRWRDFVTANGGALPAFPLPVGDETDAAHETGPAHRTHPHPDQLGGCVWLLDSDRARSFQTACRADGGNFLSGLLASLAVVGHESTGHEEFRALTPFHTRGQEAAWTGSLGWYVGLAPIRFAVRGTDAFAEVMRNAVAALDGAGAVAAVPFPRIAELLGTPLEPRFVVSYMDMRRTPGARRWGEWKAAALRSRRSHPDEVYLWINRSYEGVYVSYRHPNTERARLAVSRFIADTGRLMNAIAAPTPPAAPPAASAAASVEASTPTPVPVSAPAATRVKEAAAC
ncbi:condensation domain-containing protein [Streptomyces sp. NBC_01429]|uniref:condensation domain-containing protein n=1 Tax=Streptomyces sp. NBC_01429 TaxID=2903862 RepID=UPI002E291602|nr:condensation domain-containing protein [Streptomyces sp. NBC_01429]